VRPDLEVADIFRAAGPAWRRDERGHLSLAQLKVMSAIEQCRSAALGGHVLRCTACAQPQIAYNSCRNRHCPKCQGSAALRWLEDRQADLLPVEYYHVVFTLPAPVAAIAYYNKEVVYGLLFEITAQTLRIIAAKCGAPHLAANAANIAMRTPAPESSDFRYFERSFLHIKERAVKDSINLSLARNRPDLSLGAVIDSSASSFIDGSARV
jgi:Transposase zinc-binding domain